MLRKENYRPVNILTSTSKVYEKIMDNQISKHVFSDELSAFREGYSTQYVLVNIVEKLKSALDRSKCGGALLMDLSKVFDCILCDLIIAKLKAYGMSNQSLAFMCSYLHNRKQRVNVLGEKVTG